MNELDYHVTLMANTFRLNVKTSPTISRPVLRSHELITDFSRFLLKLTVQKLFWCIRKVRFQVRQLTELNLKKTPRVYVCVRVKMEGNKSAHASSDED